MKIDIDRLRRDLETLRTIGRTETGGVSRTSFSAADSAARRWYLQRCTEAGLHVQVDGLGNMVVHAQDEPTGATPVWTGSHLDSVPDGGFLDGALGSIAALECLRRLTEEKVPLARPVRAVVFSDEEGNYNHLLGSTGIAKGFDRAQLESMTGRDGDRLVDRFAELGWDLDAATRTRVEHGEVHAFVELHIEQGPNLEADGFDIGVVTSIVGLGGGKARFHGQADHAGTTPMTKRKDALLGAADFLTTLPGIAASVSDAAVVTCGLIGVEPGGSNVVPGTATVTVDFRDPDQDRLRALGEAIERSAHEAAERHRLTVTWQPDMPVAPVPLAEGIRATITAAAQRLGYRTTTMPSGAGHDSQNMALITPTAMIFVPSKDGRSHSPAEDTSWADIAKGGNVLLSTLLTLASQEGTP